ncbi:ADP-ribosylglycohydrolase family protein [Treponema sp. TIM-1]|uniref:ADP-ribosylglycohydrolase family protein n=1 Tax=Treponema sp. TIM-1 TaxID=2898417 RepID=UPI00398089DD
MTDLEYLTKVYAGFLGMNIGIRLGAPVEPSLWTSDRIKRFYGEITGYVKDFKNFAADDDVNGPVYFFRALEDGAFDHGLRPQDVAEAWLNYTRDGVGMFWWGGYGISTEHTAYENLKQGVEAPRSGSIVTNGKTLAEQIGGQIFIDTWGLACPGDPGMAAKLALTAAGVSHDGEALHGAAFIAACIAAAFDGRDRILDTALDHIPPESSYARVVRGVREFHRDHGGSWRDCLTYLQENWGYDKYPGACHIIPNAGVCAMALVYAGSFSQGIEIATMAGWDTDCNAGNVGTILGVAYGIAGIPEAYRIPVNDGVVLSGISGSLNILDIPGYAKKIAAAHYRLQKEKVPDLLRITDGTVDFDFLLPGSTHNLRLSNPNSCRARHNPRGGVNNSGALEVLFDRMIRGESCRIYYKPFYRREDFDDERYMPVFSPTIYPGQTVRIRFRLERFSGESISISPYVRNTATKACIPLGGAIYRDPDWHELTFTISPEDPRLVGAMIDEVGLILEANSPVKNKDLGCLYIDHFTAEGKGNYTIDLAQQAKEFGSVTSFSHNRGAWSLERDPLGTVYMEAMTADRGEAMTGNYYMRDISLEGTLVPHNGVSHLAGLRIQGARRGYYAGFDGAGRVSILKQDKTMTGLVSVPFHWEYDRPYRIAFEARGEELRAAIDGTWLLSCRDSSLDHGMAGYALFGMGRCGFGNLTLREL